MSLIDEATNFLRSTGQEWVDGVKDFYTEEWRAINTGLKTVTPIGAASAIDKITDGVSSLGRDAIDFFDPVSYATELMSDGLSMMQPKRMLEKGTNIYLTAKGVDRTEQLKQQFIDEALLAGQAAALLIPAGTITKPITKSLKKGVKAAKQAVKQTARGTPERKIAREDLRHAKTKRRVVGATTKNSVRIGKQVSRDQLQNLRENNGYSPMFTSRSHVTKRDWDKFGQEAQEKWRDDEWNRKNWKRK